jgi:hypothetical protein
MPLLVAFTVFVLAPIAALAVLWVSARFVGELFRAIRARHADVVREEPASVTAQVIPFAPRPRRAVPIESAESQDVAKAA